MIASPTRVTPDLDGSRIDPLSFNDDLSVPSPHLEIDDVQPLPDVKVPTPKHVAVVAFYDIGCVTAWVVSKYDILGDVGADVVQRLQFETRAMHAYGHEWACQLVYNLHLTHGLGLSDDAPARLKKQLDTVITLQSDLDTSEKALQVARNTIANDPVASESLEVPDDLERTYSQLKTKVDALYASLNDQDQYPELDGIEFDFVRVLLLARDLKINIRKRAIGSIFEWDTLDQAVGGDKNL
ncbi:hypothetical protein HD554DRAFT_2176019 [Boletus coccyginus]|nr:hypothetical protein HD554DRAFT_2176019 [Boletus coccyginus]